MYPFDDPFADELVEYLPMLGAELVAEDGDELGAEAKGERAQVVALRHVEAMLLTPLVDAQHDVDELGGDAVRVLVGQIVEVVEQQLVEVDDELELHVILRVLEVQAEYAHDGDHNLVEQVLPVLARAHQALQTRLMLGLLFFIHVIIVVVVVVVVVFILDAALLARRRATLLGHASSASVPRGRDRRCRCRRRRCRGEFGECAECLVDGVAVEAQGLLEHVARVAEADVALHELERLVDARLVEVEERLLVVATRRSLRLVKLEHVCGHVYSHGEEQL